MRKLSTALLLVFLTVLVAAAPLPALNVKGSSGHKSTRGDSDWVFSPHKKIILKATDITSAKAQFLWDVEGNADIYESGDTLFVWAPPGKYKVRLTAIDFDAKKVERATFNFEIVGEVPGPGPGPGPGPLPTDELTKSLQAAYDSCTDTDKATSIKGLATVYSTGATLVRERKPVTGGAVWAALAAGAEAAKVKGKVPKVQQAVATYMKLQGNLMASTSLDDATRTKLADQLDKVGASLGKVR